MVIGVLSASGWIANSPRQLAAARRQGSPRWRSPRGVAPRRAYRGRAVACSVSGFWPWGRAGLQSRRRVSSPTRCQAACVGDHEPPDAIGETAFQTAHRFVVGFARGDLRVVVGRLALAAMRTWVVSAMMCRARWAVGHHREASGVSSGLRWRPRPARRRRSWANAEASVARRATRRQQQVGRSAAPRRELTRGKIN
jgi:hypothetical protein